MPKSTPLFSPWSSKPQANDNNIIVALNKEFVGVRKFGLDRVFVSFCKVSVKYRGSFWVV